MNNNNCETKQSLFLTPFVRFGFNKFGTDKPNIITTIGIKNTERKTLMQTKMRHNHEQLKRKLAAETPEFGTIIVQCRT
ncbi:hypothetical protein ERW51_18410 [Aliivibrio finisterrensis]|nr:hypothetical protein ERW54_18720 [Aliivibrio finisterrensis]RYU66388.1 hypothetical protein ERW51_18410 [Aliivibrio finisterrensis]RYU69724.1 hypothetical protein ERW48_18775 [Aliivibrio finisterrensis]